MVFGAVVGTSGRQCGSPCLPCGAWIGQVAAPSMKPLSNTIRHRLLAPLVALGFALVAVLHPESVIRSPEAMDRYFGGEVAPGAWQWVGSWSGDIPPFKYRVVFRGLVEGLASLLSLVGGRTLPVYWTALVVGTIASIVFAVVAAWRFLAVAGVRSACVRYAALGMWFCMPPFHNAFVIPTQTKEDFLAYGMMFAGLAALLQSRFRWVVFWTVVGVATRETMLLLSVVMVLGSAASPKMKVISFVSGLATLVGVRAIQGFGGHELIRPENFHGVLIPVALFCVFGFGWLLVGARLAPARLRADLGAVLDSIRSRTGGGSPCERFEASFVPVAVLLLSLHVLAARIAEIRISFLLAPWLVLAAGRWLAGRTEGRRWFRSVVGGGVMMFVVVGLEWSGAMSAVRVAMNPLIAEFGARVWWLEIEVQMVLMAALLGHGRR